MAGRSDSGSIEAFVNDLGLSGFPHVIDNNDLWARFKVRSQPAFAFIDDNGTITVHNGPLGADALAARLEELQR